MKESLIVLVAIYILGCVPKYEYYNIQNKEESNKYYNKEAGNKTHEYFQKIAQNYKEKKHEDVEKTCIIMANYLGTINILKTDYNRLTNEQKLIIPSITAYENTIKICQEILSQEMNTYADIILAEVKSIEQWNNIENTCNTIENIIPIKNATWTFNTLSIELQLKFTNETQADSIKDICSNIPIKKANYITIQQNFKIEKLLNDGNFETARVECLKIIPDSTLSLTEMCKNISVLENQYKEEQEKKIKENNRQESKKIIEMYNTNASYENALEQCQLHQKTYDENPGICYSVMQNIIKNSVINFYTDKKNKCEQKFKTEKDDMTDDITISGNEYIVDKKIKLSISNYNKTSYLSITYPLSLCKGDGTSIYILFDDETKIELFDNSSFICDRFTLIKINLESKELINKKMKKIRVMLYKGNSIEFNISSINATNIQKDIKCILGKMFKDNL